MGEADSSMDPSVETGGMHLDKIKNIVEGALLAAGRPVKLEELEALFKDDERPERNRLRQAIEALQEDYTDRAMELRQVASGFRIQVRDSVTDWVSRLWEERPTRYSRALLETLALIAYRQPITRGEIEEVRGVSVSSSIVRTLQERGWIKVVGHRDVPGRPAMFGTTREFLDYFGLKSLDQLPTLAEIRDIDSINVELELDPSDDDRFAQTSTRNDGQEHSDGTDLEQDGDSSMDSDSGSDVEAEWSEEDAEDDTQAGIVDDAEHGDSVDERNLGQTAEEDPFEEGVYEAEEAGEELDFEEAHEQTHEEEGRQEGHLETEAEEAQGPGPETPAREEDGEEDQHRQDERGRSDS